jgi:ABC-type phosphate transport system substrate-binding protein
MFSSPLRRCLALADVERSCRRASDDRDAESQLDVRLAAGREGNLLMRKSLVGGAIAAAALVTSMMTTAPAHADPAFTPDNNDMVGVGSDTTEFLMQKIAGAFNAAHVGGTVRMASWNATGSANITPRRNANSIPRPNGSSAGVDALQATNSLTFARSSRGPNPSGDEGTAFFPYATDGLGYAFATGTHAKLNLTANQLALIYTCQRTNWNQFSRPAGHIKAFVPQPGSGTRTFFLSSIGVTETQLQDSIAQPNATCNVSESQEHDPAPLVGDLNAIAPFSRARYKTLPAGTRANVKINNPANGYSPIRNVYNVIRTSQIGTYGQYFDNGSWLCTSTKANQVITQQGFKRLGAAQCGVPILA